MTAALGPAKHTRVSTWQDRYLDRFYRSRPGWVDGTTEFHELCRSHVAKGSKILEIGSGPSNATSRFLATLGELHGADVSSEVRGNDALKSASGTEGSALPFPDATFDACVSNYVAEHVPDPVGQLREIFRVLRPGGRYILRTPNRFHYVAIVAGATPHWFHELVANRLRNLPDTAHDPYPVLYRMNTPGALRRVSAAAGLEDEDLRAVEKEPSYGMFARPLFLGFMAYERLVNASAALGFARANLFAVLRKPGGTVN